MARPIGQGLLIKCHKIQKRLSEEQKGPFADSVAILRLTEQLRADPESVDYARIARQVWKQYDARVRPKPTSPGGLYHPERLIPAAKGQRVQMQLAGPAQLVFWDDVDAKAFVQTERARNTRKDYNLERLKAFADYPAFITLDAIEINVFGYVRPPLDTLPGELFDDDDDDGLEA